jgi:K+-sensing histidine kinase KdpD
MAAEGPATTKTGAGVTAEQTIPKTQYAESDGLSIAYQVFGNGSQDLVIVPGTISHAEADWEIPGHATGIPPEELERVFEQFHQIDNSNTKAKGGTGLGLAISKQIVEMHGGRIWVESTLGKGATFQMELPVRAEDRKSAQ